jgi:Zn-dependent protease
MLFDGLSPATLVSRILVLLIAFTIHEFAHAYTADRFGDSTPRANGRLTLNPIAHLDPIGTLLMLFRGFGWAKPVPVNPYALGKHSPSALMWVSLAGPMSNLAMAAVAAIPLRFHLLPYTPSGDYIPSLPDFLWDFMVINLVLALFNLIPIAPLDGDKIAAFFFPPPLARIFDAIRPYGPIVLLLLVFVPGRFGYDVFGWMMQPALSNLLSLLIGG